MLKNDSVRRAINAVIRKGLVPALTLYELAAGNKPLPFLSVCSRGISNFQTSPGTKK